MPEVLTPERLDIRGLVIEPEQPHELVFRRDRESLLEGWNENFNQSRFRSNLWDAFHDADMYAAFAIKIVCGISAYDLGFRQRDQRKILKRIRKPDNWNYKSTNLDLLAVFKILFPNNYKKIQNLDELEKASKHQEPANEFDRNISLFAERLLHPDKDLEPKAEESWEELKKSVDILRETQNWELLLTAMSRARIAFPEHYQSISFTNAELRDIQEHLDSANFQNYIESTAALKIMLAEEVRVTESGIEIIPKISHLDQSTPELPATRSF